MSQTIMALQYRLKELQLIINCHNKQVFHEILLCKYIFNMLFLQPFHKISSHSSVQFCLNLFYLFLVYRQPKRQYSMHANKTHGMVTNRPFHIETEETMTFIKWMLT